MHPAGLGFFDLPREIRDLIYQYAIGQAPRRQHIYSVSHVSLTGGQKLWQFQSNTKKASSRQLKTEIKFLRPVHPGLVSHQFFQEYEHLAGRQITALLGPTYNSFVREGTDYIRELRQPVAVQNLRIFPVSVFVPYIVPITPFRGASYTQGNYSSITKEEHHPSQYILENLRYFVFSSLTQLAGLEIIEIIVSGDRISRPFSYMKISRFKNLFQILKRLQMIKASDEWNSDMHWTMVRNNGEVIVSEQAQELDEFELIFIENIGVSRSVPQP